MGIERQEEKPAGSRGPHSRRYYGGNLGYFFFVVAFAFGFAVGAFFFGAAFFFVAKRFTSFHILCDACDCVPNLTPLG